MFVLHNLHIIKEAAIFINNQTMERSWVLGLSGFDNEGQPTGETFLLPMNKAPLNAASEILTDFGFSITETTFEQFKNFYPDDMNNIFKLDFQKID